MATATFDKPLNEDLAKLESHLDDIGIVVDGNKTSYASGAAQGQYVVLKNSSIVDSGSDMLADGLYTAAKAIPYNTVIDKTYLTQCSGGGLNALNSKLSWKYLGEKTSNTAMAYPSSFNEIMVVVGIASNSGQLGSIIVPFAECKSEKKFAVPINTASGGVDMSANILFSPNGMSVNWIPNHTAEAISRWYYR